MLTSSKCGSVVFIHLLVLSQWVPSSLFFILTLHDDVIKWKYSPRYCPFVTGEFPSQRPVTWSFDFSLIYTWINDLLNNREAGDFTRHRTHYDVTVMKNYILKMTVTFLRGQWVKVGLTAIDYSMEKGHTECILRCRFMKAIRLLSYFNVH